MLRPLFKDHPAGLPVLFMTEMWERFSYYGMRALLVLYLTKHFLFSDEAAYGLYGSYVALVYGMHILGGAIADRYLGYRKAVLFGAVLLVCGHFGMAFEGPIAQKVTTTQGVDVIVRSSQHEQILYLSLALIITGVGFLKSNISTIVGTLYEENDPRRDAGFTLYYMGINIGALMAMLLCGWLGEAYGWAYGFGLAGFGMLMGMIVFSRGQQALEGRAEPKKPELLRQKVMGIVSVEHAIYAGGVAAVIVIWQLVQRAELVGDILQYGGGGVVLAVIFYAVLKCNAVDRNRLFVLLTLTFFSVLFWSLFEQQATSMTLFTDRVVDRELWGLTVPAATVPFLNPLIIILFAPVFSGLWLALARAGRDPSTPMKFVLALLLMGSSFGVLVLSAQFTGPEGQVALIWLVLVYFLQTTGELCLSPVGLSAVTKLSLAHIASLLMGVWFLSNAAAGFVGAKIAAMTSANGRIEGVDQLGVYTDTFATIFWVSMVMAAALLLLTPLLKRGMAGIK